MYLFEVFTFFTEIKLLLISEVRDFAHFQKRKEIQVSKFTK